MWRKSAILSAVIGSGLDCSDALNASSMSPKSILLSSCFSIAVLLTKAAPVIRSPNNTAIKLCAKAWRYSRDPSRRVGDKYDLDQRRGAVAMNDSKSSRRSTMLRLNADTSRHEKEIEGPESEDGEGQATRRGDDCHQDQTHNPRRHLQHHHARRAFTTSQGSDRAGRVADMA